MTDTLLDIVTETHHVLTARLTEAETSHPTRELPRAQFTATDPFLASASRHIAAANAVLAPAARRHLPHGREWAQALAQQSRRLEVALFQAKAKLFGSSFAVRRPWASVWHDVETELASFRSLEQRLVTELGDQLGALDRDRVALALYRAEHGAPTRPHPYLPHGGLPGQVARSITCRVDRFWDTAEGRMVPEPVRPQRSRDGRMTRYLLAETDIDDGEPDATG